MRPCIYSTPQIQKWKLYKMSYKYKNEKRRVTNMKIIDPHLHTHRGLNIDFYILKTKSNFTLLIYILYPGIGERYNKKV